MEGRQVTDRRGDGKRWRVDFAFLGGEGFKGEGRDPPKEWLGGWGGGGVCPGGTTFYIRKGLAGRSLGSRLERKRSSLGSELEILDLKAGYQKSLM